MMKRMILAGAVVQALCSPAYGATKMSCSVDDAAVRMVLESGVGSAGIRLFDFRGALTLKPALPAPENLRYTRFEKQNLMQNWLDGGELRLRVYSETGRGDATASTDLLVLARASKSDGGRYGGTYRLTLLRPKAQKESDRQAAQASGKISCSIE